MKLASSNAVGGVFGALLAIALCLLGLACGGALVLWSLGFFFTLPDWGFLHALGAGCLLFAAARVLAGAR